MKRPFNWVLPILLTLLAFGLRAYHLESQSYWIDEAWTVYFANLTFAQLWHLLETVEPLPPFYHPSTILWRYLVGDSEFAMRFYSLWFGVLTVPLTYRLGRDLGDKRLGLIAALLMTVAPFQIWHSQEARMYSTLTATSALSMWGFINLWHRRAFDIHWPANGWANWRLPLFRSPNRYWWLIYLLGTEWAIMTHYHGVVLLGIQGLFLLLTAHHHWRGYLLWGSTLGLIILILVPWLIFGWNLLQAYLNWIAQPTLWESFVRSATAYSVGRIVPPEEAWPMTLPFVGLYFLGLIYAGRRRWRQWTGWDMVALMVAFTIAPNLAAWLYGEYRTTVYYERYLIFVQIGYLLTVAMGLLAIYDLRLAPRPIRLLTAAGGLGLLLGLSGYNLDNYYHHPVYSRANWRGVADFIAAFGQPGDGILLTGDGGDHAFNYYYQEDLPVYYPYNISPHIPGVPRLDGAAALDKLADIAGQHRRLWYTPYGMYLDPTLEAWLLENSYPAWQRWMGSKRLALYGSPQLSIDRLTTFKARLTSELTLQSVNLTADPIPANDLLPLQFIWHKTADLTVDYRLSLRLTNELGDIFAQTDWPPLSQQLALNEGPSVVTRQALWLPVDLPPATYQLQIHLYDGSSGQPLAEPLTIPEITILPADITPPLEALDRPNPSDHSLGPLALVGYILPETIRPGEDIWAWLYWQCRASRSACQAALTDSLTITLDDIDQTIERPLFANATPETAGDWQPGQVRRAVYHLPTTPRLTGQTVQITLSLSTTNGLVDPTIGLPAIALETRPRQFEPPAMEQPLEVTLGQPPRLKLLGYDSQPNFFQSSDRQLHVTLYWQAVAEMTTNYTVFVHLLNRDQQVVAQADAYPLAGQAPTKSWLPGEILTDHYTLTLPELPAGEYQLIAGLYNATDGSRLITETGDNFIELRRVIIDDLDTSQK